MMMIGETMFDVRCSVFDSLAWFAAVCMLLY